jgi:hypothetical protein
MWKQLCCVQKTMVWYTTPILIMYHVPCTMQQDANTLDLKFNISSKLHINPNSPSLCAGRLRVKTGELSKTLEASTKLRNV